MTLQNTTIIRAQDMTSEQREERGIEVEEGLIAVETHNSNYETKIKVLRKGIIEYIIDGI